jgi:hypothetical protein
MVGTGMDTTQNAPLALRAFRLSADRKISKQIPDSEQRLLVVERIPGFITHSLHRLLDLPGLYLKRLEIGIFMYLRCVNFFEKEIG